MNRRDGSYTSYRSEEITNFDAQGANYDLRKCWELNISEQFPIQLTNQVDGDAEVMVKQPHQGYVIKTTIVDLKMNGESYIFSDKGIHIATLTFVDGIASGPCTINDDSGLLWFEGRFENVYRHGRGKEYDKNGSITFEGFYERGKKLRIYRMEEMEGYWKEIDEDNILIRICEKDDEGLNDGMCYLYNNGAISRISNWKNGKEIELLKQFFSKTMIE